MYTRVSLRTTRWLAKHAAGPLSRLMRYRLGRILVLGQSHGRPSRVSPDHARTAIRDMGTGPGFDRTMKATERRRYVSGSPIDGPVTVAFGSRDFVLLPRQSRHLDELPPGTRVETVAGGGHVPMPTTPTPSPPSSPQPPTPRQSRGKAARRDCGRTPPHPLHSVSTYATVGLVYPIAPNTRARKTVARMGPSPSNWMPRRCRY
jgi:hypothetical protein